MKCLMDRAVAEADICIFLFFPPVADCIRKLPKLQRGI